MMLIGRKYSGVVCSVNQGARAGRRSARRRSQHHRCRGPEEREAEAASEREAGVGVVMGHGPNGLFTAQ